MWYVGLAIVVLFVVVAVGLALMGHPEPLNCAKAVVDTAVDGVNHVSNCTK